MLLWALAAVAALAIAALQYWWGGAPPRRAAAPAALRTGALTFLLAALLDAPLGRARAPEALVALDASASWRRGGDTLAWREARTRAGGRGGDSLVLFGDSARGTRSAPGTPSDAASRVRPAVERAVAAGRPIVVVTDGEIDDPDALRRLPAGSRVEVVPRAARPDGALAALDAPRAASRRAGTSASPPGSGGRRGRSRRCRSARCGARCAARRSPCCTATATSSGRRAP